MVRASRLLMSLARWSEKISVKTEIHGYYLIKKDNKKVKWKGWNNI